MERCKGVWRGVTAGSTLRADLTFIVSVSLTYYLNSHFFNIISAILFFSKLLPENPSIHADSRKSKNIQAFVNTLDILESS